MRTDIFSKRVIRFLKKHFDHTTLIGLGAVVLIGWAKYNSESYACIDGNCLEVVDGNYFSRAECHRNCAAVDSPIRNNNKPASTSLKTNEISVLWGSPMSNGNVWYSNALQQSDRQLYVTQSLPLSP